MLRRRPLMRAAVIGGTAAAAGNRMAKSHQREEDQNAQIAELQAQQQQPAAPAAPAPAGEEGLADQLVKLKSLLDSGVLTPDEFAAAKQRIIAGG